MRVPRVGLLPFVRLWRNRNADVFDPRDVDWNSPEGRELLGEQHWNDRLWHPPRRAESLRDALRR